MTPDLDSILEAHRAGDPAAIDRLIEYCADRVARMAARLLRGFPHVARWERPSDIAQNASIRLHEALRSVMPKDQAHLLALAAKKVREELHDRARSHEGQKRGNNNLFSQGDVPADRHAAYAAPADDPGPMTNEQWDRFLQAIETLPGEQRAVFDMKWFMDADEATIATAMNVSRSTVQRLWSEAKRHVKSRCDVPPG